MRHSMMDQAAALSGVFQAAELVDKLAKTGQCDSEVMNASINSIFITSPQSVSEVYGGFEHLSTGRKSLESVLSRNSSAIQGDVVRYALALIHIEKKLSRNSKMLGTISSRLARSQEQANHFGSNHENVISSLASVYLDTISTFKTRIQVNGDARHLQNTMNASRIRAVLLAGIRSAMLWRQCGGSRWHLFIGRNKLLGAVKRLPS
ncbi:high frequency lysogenization protein HflD [Endozoicomonas ascidiicola]|uniref:high frequency lysogenization protein HflD n=1 Tax=Endozoicomonas ascidiicola TaxID=1698521 RepID=UPI000BA4A3D7|nr:high frequency lysogenization protein HflD [Endozoicomonas ascidiicola]